MVVVPYMLSMLDMALSFHQARESFPLLLARCDINTTTIHVGKCDDLEIGI